MREQIVQELQSASETISSVKQKKAKDLKSLLDSLLTLLQDPNAYAPLFSKPLCFFRAVPQTPSTERHACFDSLISRLGLYSEVFRGLALIGRWKKDTPPFDFSGKCLALLSRIPGKRKKQQVKHLEPWYKKLVELCMLVQKKVELPTSTDRKWKDLFSLSFAMLCSLSKYCIEYVLPIYSSSFSIAKSCLKDRIGFNLVLTTECIPNQTPYSSSSKQNVLVKITSVFEENTRGLLASARQCIPDFDKIFGEGDMIVEGHEVEHRLSRPSAGDQKKQKSERIIQKKLLAQVVGEKAICRIPLPQIFNFATRLSLGEELIARIDDAFTSSLNYLDEERGKQDFTAPQQKTLLKNCQLHATLLIRLRVLLQDSLWLLSDTPLPKLTEKDPLGLGEPLMRLLSLKPLVTAAAGKGKRRKAKKPSSTFPAKFPKNKVAPKDLQPWMKVSAILDILAELGFEKVRQRGSHAQLKKTTPSGEGATTVTVPIHGGNMPLSRDTFGEIKKRVQPFYAQDGQAPSLC
ncbi:MAG: type II toxin-antitoxin system HicA family toxin [Chlamydiota bacterium]